MRKSPSINYILFSSVLLLMFSILTSCSGDGKLQDQVSGTWKRAQSDGVVAINLANESKSLVIDGKTFPASIENVDNGAYLIRLKVQTESKPAETWTLRQVWNNNGSDFKLVFSHNGIEETLEKGTHS